MDDFGAWLNFFIIPVSLITGLLTIYGYFKLTRSIQLKVSETWLDKDHVIFNIVIVNSSKLRIKKEYIKFQVLEYDLNEKKGLSEWVPFKCGAIREDEGPKEGLIEWTEPQEILKTTDYLYANDSVRVDRMYALKNNNSLLHVGLQFKSESWKILRKFANGDQWTTTLITKNLI